MDVNLIINVGNHDMKPAELAAQLDSTNQVDWKQIQFPLLEKYLAYVKLNRLNLRHVTLVGTSQPESTREEFRRKDTAKVAHLMEKWLQQVHKVSVRVLEYTDNPTIWEDLYDYYQKKLPKLPEADRYLVGVTGGPPQMNTTLLLAALDHLPNVTLLAASESAAQPRIVGIGQSLKKRDIVRAIESHLSHLDFHAALSLLDENPDLFANTRDYNFCRALLQHADHRACFRFQEAAQDLSRVLASAPDSDARKAGDYLLDKAAALASADLAPDYEGATADDGIRLHEMVRLAQQYAQRGLYLGIPALVYTFTDAPGGGRIGPPGRTGPLRRREEAVGSPCAQRTCRRRAGAIPAPPCLLPADR